METIEALIHRRSCRKYSDRPVEAEKLARMIEAGQYAPSGMGRQPVTFVAVTDPATVERLSQLNAQVMGSEGDPFYGAKTVVVVLVDRSVPTHLEDGSLAMGNLLNAAYALGVDSCWIHRAHEVFDSPEGLELLAKWGLPADGSLRGVGNSPRLEKHYEPRIAAGSIGRGKDVSAGSAFQRGFPCVYESIGGDWILRENRRRKKRSNTLLLVK